MKAGALRDAVLGLLSLALIVGGLAVAYLSYNRVLIPHDDITLRTDVVGNALQVGSDVKFHGVPVGQISKITSTAEGADLTLAIDPSTMKLLPENVVARLLPKTMFGERYVALTEPSVGTTTAVLHAGDVIHQDASAEAAELQQVFDALLPVLKAIQPEKLSAMLGEFAIMLHGNGAKIGDAMVAWSHYMKKMNPKVPQMTQDFADLATVANSWDIAAPDLVDALSTMTTSSKLLVDEQTNLRNVYASVIGSADSARHWFDVNSTTMIVLSKASRAALRASSPYAAEFPCLFKAVANMKTTMDTALGKGTNQPGLHAVLKVIPAGEKYVAGKDDVRYTKGTPKPRCPYVTGHVGTTAVDRTVTTGSGTSVAEWPEAASTDIKAATDDTPATIAPPPGTTAQSYLYAMSGLGEANSPAENQWIAELVGPTQGIAPSAYPAWNSLLLGPTLRNTKVELR
ncbi:MCE family protein [Nocardioides sp.]|uniref:MCE family protein n=1 Tax=Nocardioides sp. TaxID=35761 RepID=UPI002637351D|nr:MCE family protein [Nocardioides sp.]